MGRESMQKAYDFVEIFKPRVAVPFGASIFYNGGYDHPLNKYLARPFDFQGGFVMLAGDAIWEAGTMTASSRRIESTEPDEYEEMLRSTLGPGKGAPLDLDFTWELPWAPKKFWKRFQVNGVDVTETTTGQLHRFDFSREVFEEWRAGRITFEQAIGTRRFRFVREPDLVDTKVFTWMNREL
jgi:hypothetical protein